MENPLPGKPPARSRRNRSVRRRGQQAPKPSRRASQAPMRARRARTAPSYLRRSPGPKRQKRARLQPNARSRHGRDQGGKEGRTRPGRKPEKITWAEQRKWRDGTPARLQGASSAYYLTRKIVSTRPRTAIVQIDGPAGFRMWINGELAQTSLPPPPPPPAPQRQLTPSQLPRQTARTQRTTRKPTTTKRSQSFPKSTTRTLMRRWDAAETIRRRKFRIGLRQGENEIVVKAVFGAGASPNARRVFPRRRNGPSAR